MHNAPKRSSLLLGFLTLALVLRAAAQDVMPKVEGDSLGGHHVALPAAASGKVAVLIFGFSRDSKVPTGAWGKKLSTDFNGQSAFALYQLPVLEDVPRLVRGMVTSGMRKGVAEEMRDHFVPIMNGEADLKKLVHYKETDDAYLILLDRTGKIVGQTHGPFTDAAYSQLRTQLDALLNGHK